MDNNTRESNREEKAKEIASNPAQQIFRLDDHHYKVKSQTTKIEYDVISTESGWVCSCPDSTFRNVDCKHCLAVSLSIQLRNKVKERTELVIDQIDCSKCIQCQSINIVKHGLRHNKYGNIQRFTCNDCGKWFVFNIGFEKMRVNPKAITTAMQLYFTGESLRSVQKFLRLQGVEVSHQTVYNWIKKYTQLMQNYVEKIQPKVSDTWRADEMYVKISGNQKFLYAMMDDETRFWIAQEVADTKHTHDAREFLKKSRNLMGKKPKVFITDGGKNYHEAYNKEWWTPYKDKTVHIRHIRLSGDNNNNKMERLNGEIRDREKVVRGLKKENSPLISGYQIYHNYIRPHMSLGNKTPAEACGIAVKGNDKWKTIIQRASL